MSRKRFVLMLLFDFSGVRPPRETLYLGHLQSKTQEDGLTTVLDYFLLVDGGGNRSVSW